VQHDGISVLFILPRKAGKGDRAAQQRGGRGVGGEANPLYCTPPPPCCAWSPSPALGAGADKQHRSRDALRARVMHAVARSEATKQSSQRCRTSRRLRQPNRPTGLPRFARNDEKEKRKRNADRRVYPTSALFRARRASTADKCTQVCAHKIHVTRRLSAFHHGSCVGDRTPPLSLEHALPGTRQHACPSPASSSQTGHSAGRAYCPKPPGERRVSHHPRAPHSLHLQEYPRPKASFTERDSSSTQST
jgi:hypothetical protein